MRELSQEELIELKKFKNLQDTVIKQKLKMIKSQAVIELSEAILGSLPAEMSESKKNKFKFNILRRLSETYANMIGRSRVLNFFEFELRNRKKNTMSKYKL